MSIAAMPVRDCGEPLVDVGAVEALRVDQRRRGAPTYLRAGVVDRLVAAQSLLPRHVRLIVVDAYALVDHCSPPEWAAHQSGAALDICVDGSPTDAGLLNDALLGQGFVCGHPAQWHWSYGDAYWARITGAPAARYGPVALQ